MKLYEVTVREVHEKRYLLWAETEEAARTEIEENHPIRNYSTFSIEPESVTAREVRPMAPAL